MILSNFNSYDLNRVKLVCKRWLEHILKIESRRKLLEYNFYLEPLGRTSNRKRSNDHVIQEYVKSLIKYLLEDGTAYSSLNTYIKSSLWSLPQTCLIFSSLPRKAYLSSQCFLPFYCKTISINSHYGVTGTLTDGYSVELEDNVTMTGLSSLFIPHTSSKFSMNFFRGDNHLKSHLDKEREEKGPLKCLLLFSTDNLHCSYLNDLIIERNGDFAVGGAVINEITLFSKGIAEKMSSLVITFSGEDVQSVSLIIHSKSESETDAKIKEFKDNLDFDLNCENNSQTFGFLFTCVGKGSYHYNKSNLETSLISKYFPKVKLMGVFGQGEYGHIFTNTTKPPVLDADCCKDVTENVYAHHLSYTTVVVFVRFIKN